MAARRKPAAQAGKYTEVTLQYMKETYDLLVMPDPVSPELPPLDLAGWQDVEQDVKENIDTETDAIGEDHDMQESSDAEPLATQPSLAKSGHRPALSDIKQVPASASLPVPAVATTSQASTPMSKSISSSSQSVAIIEFKESFTVRQLEFLSTAARDRGRKLKHAGDARMRASRHVPQTESDLSLLEMADSLFLYVFGFWCDDLAIGRTDENGLKTKPGCIVENWNTIFALLSFVRSKAEKSNWPCLVAALNLMEASILRNMCHHERRNLHASVEEQLHHSRHSNPLITPNPDTMDADHTPSSVGATPPVSGSSESGPAPAQAAASYTTFTKYSARVEAYTRLFAASEDVLSLAALRKHLPDFCQLCVSSTTPRRSVSEPKKPWQFSFTLDTNGGYASLCHAVCFGRAMLEAIAKQKNLSYTAEWDSVL